MFTSKSHIGPSLWTLNALYEHDDFMESIRTMVDLGCGSGEDLTWWATRTTRDEGARPLNIKCVGVDLENRLTILQRLTNVTFQQTDFEEQVNPPTEFFDVLWCHDAFQYCKNPAETLFKWRNIASDGAMLIISVPETVGISKGKFNCVLPSGVLYNHTLVSLIYMLANAGWDCRNGFFYQQSPDPWIRAVVYKQQKNSDTIKYHTWYELVEQNILPESADRSIKAHGYLRQQDLVLPWLDHNLYLP